MTDLTAAIDAAALAELFHEAYERLAPSHGYETREASRKPWADVPENNRALMTAVCAELLPHLRAAWAERAAKAIEAECIDPEWPNDDISVNGARAAAIVREMGATDA